MTPATRVLLVPGWLDSGPDHWQTRWEALHGFERVEQADWEWPRRGDWMVRLDEVLQADERPVLLAAHSLGCHLVAAWAAHSQYTARVTGALLVAPPDTERDETPPQLHNWRPIVRRRMPFPATVIFSDNDPYGTPQRMRALAQDWGATMLSIGAAGHINAESGLADWPEGLARLRALADLP